MQSNPILYNAYGILGLVPNATRKDIERQTKEIEKLLKIDEIPQYTLDFSHFDKLRNEKNIREAKQNLLNAESKILHYFFSFYITSDSEAFAKRAMDLYKSGDFHAFHTFIDKKNMAIFLCIYILCVWDTLSNKNDEIDIKQYLALWSEVISDENLSKFKKIYLHDDDIGINDNILNGADSAIKNALILSHTHFAESLKDELVKRNFIANIIDIFSPSDEVVNDIKFIADIYKKINEDISAIENASAISTLKSHILKLNTHFNQLRKLNLNARSQTSLLKDRISKILRDKSFYLNNELNDAESALNIIDEALKMCGSNFERSKLQKSKEQLNDLIKHKQISKLLDEVKSKVNKGDFYGFDEIEAKIRAISPKNSDDFIDQIAVIIGNKAIENANNALKYITSYDRNTAIITLNNANNELESRLNIAKKYAKKQRTRDWLNNQMPKASDRAKLQKAANSISGGGESSGWDAFWGIFWFIVIVIAIAKCSGA
ncbi:hypothetical protein ACWIUD_08660 [Helicobacter sp. 23-1044]